MNYKFLLRSFLTAVAAFSAVAVGGVALAYSVMYMSPAWLAGLILAGLFIYIWQVFYKDLP